MRIKHVGNFMKEQIDSRNLKQKEVAALSDIHEQTLSRNLKDPSWDIDRFCKVSEVLGANPIDFFKQIMGEEETADCNVTNNEVSNVTNLFGTIGKITSGAEQDTSLLKTMISLQAATIESKDAIIREKDAIIREKERLIEVLMEGKSKPTPL